MTEYFHRHPGPLGVISTQPCSTRGRPQAHRLPASNAQIFFLRGPSCSVQALASHDYHAHKQAKKATQNTSWPSAPASLKDSEDMDVIFLETRVLNIINGLQIHEKGCGCVEASARTRPAASSLRKNGNSLNGR